MENNMLQGVKKHFSKVGLRYFIGVLIIFASQIIISGICTAIWPQILEDYNLYFLSMMMPMYIIAMPIMIYLIQRVPAESIVEKKKMKFSHGLAAFLMCYAGTIVTNLVGLGITSVVGVLKQGQVNNVMANIATSINPVVAILITVICAPIAEELLFRKLLIDRTAKYGEGTAIVLSGFMFGLFHGNLNQFVYAFFLGVFFGFIYVKTRNVLHAIFLHMAVNFVGTVAAPLVLDISGYNEIAEATMNGATEAEIMAISMENAVGMLLLGLFGIVIFGMIIAGLILFIVNRKKFTLSQGEVVIPKGKRFSTVILNLGMILYCVFWIVQIIIQLLA